MVKTGWEEQYWLAISCFYGSGTVSGYLGLTGQSAKIYSFQMAEICQVTFDGHYSLPRLNLVAIMKCTNFDSFWMMGTFLNQSNCFVYTAESSIIPLEDLHGNSWMVFGKIQDFLSTEKIYIAIKTALYLVYWKIKGIWI